MLRNIYSYLFTNFYKNLDFSLLDTRNCLIHIQICCNLKLHIWCKAAVNSIVNTSIECRMFWFSHFSELVDHSYVYKFMQQCVRNFLIGGLK
jgi:hypothetical protein